MKTMTEKHKKRSTQAQQKVNKNRNMLNIQVEI